MGKYSRLGKNTVLVFIGNAGTKLIGLIMLPFYTKWLSVADYGLTDIMNVYMTLGIGLVSCCLGESLFIFPKNADSRNKREYFSSGILFLMLMIALTALLSGTLVYIGQRFALHNSFFDNIWLIYGMIVCLLAQQVTQQFARSLDKMLTYSTTGIVVTLATALFAFVFIPSRGVYGYVMSLNIAHLCGATYSFIFSGAYRYFSIHSFSRNKCCEMLRYSIPLIPNGIMWWLVGALNRPILEASVGLDGIGLFAVANKFPGILTMLFSVFIVSWQISILEEYGKPGFHAFYNKVFRVVFSSLFLLFIGIVICSRGLVMLLASPEYFGAWMFIPMLSMGALFSAMSGMSGTVFSATKQSKYFFYSSVWGAISAIVANALLIPLWDVWGATLSVVLSFLTMAVCRLGYAWKYIHIVRLGKYALMLLVSLLSLCTVLISNIKWFYAINIVFAICMIIINWDLRKELIKLKHYNR